MKADPLLPLYREQHGARAGRDRLELLTALIDGPAVDPRFRGEGISIPARPPVFRWGAWWLAASGPARAAWRCAMFITVRLSRRSDSLWEP